MFGLAPVQQARTVTLDLEPTTLRRAVPALAQATGLPLGVVANMADEVVQIKVTDVDAEALLAKVAEAVGGKWAKEASGTLRLMDDQELVRQARRASLEARAKALAEEVAKMAKDLDENPEFDPAKFAEQAGLRIERGPDGGDLRVERRAEGGRISMPATPGHRAAVRILKGIPAQELAAIPEGGRVVYSSQPTAMQRRIPGNPMRDVAAFLAEEQKMQGMWQGRRQGERQGERQGVPAQPQRPQEPQNPGKVFLIVHRLGDGLNVQYVVADTEGRSMGQGFTRLQPGGIRLPAQFLGWAADDGRQAPAAPASGAKFSEGAVAAARALNPRFGGPAQVMMGAVDGADIAMVTIEDDGEPSQPVEPAKSLLDLLKKPADHEPLSLFVGEAVSMLAGDADLVACLPDSALRDLAGIVARGTATGLDSDARPYTVKREDGWVTVAPRDLGRARDERADRMALQALTVRIASDKVARLAPLAAYSLKAPPVAGGLDEAVVLALDRSAAQRFRGIYGDSRAAYNVFARLQGQDFSALASGVSKPLAGIAGASAAVGSMVFNSSDGPSVEREGGAQSPGRGLEGAVFEAAAAILPGVGERGFRFGGPRSLLDERTEVLPRGLPGDALLTMSQQASDTLFAFGPNGTGRTVSPEQLGRERAAIETFAQGRGPNLANERYAPMSQTVYTMKFLLAPGVTISRTLVDPAAPDLSSAASAEALSGVAGEVYRKSYAQAKERLARVGERVGGRRGERNPPPP